MYNPLVESGYSDDVFTPWDIINTIHDKTYAIPAKLQREAGTIVRGKAILDAITATIHTVNAIDIGKGINLKLVDNKLVRVVALESVMQKLPEAINGGGQVVEQYKLFTLR